MPRFKKSTHKKHQCYIFQRSLHLRKIGFYQNGICTLNISYNCSSASRINDYSNLIFIGKRITKYYTVMILEYKNDSSNKYRDNITAIFASFVVIIDMLKFIERVIDYSYTIFRLQNKCKFTHI